VASLLIAGGADNRLVVSGTVSAELGHRLPLAGGETDGIYAGWHWDGERLAIDTDRYGFYPLFAWIDERTTALATSVDELLALGAPRDLDVDALAVFVRLGFFLEADTPFRAIRAVPPRPRIEGRPPFLRLHGRPPAVRLSAMPRAAAVDAFIDLFRQSMARRDAPGPLHLPLSGGRDSRHILFELARQGRLPAACVTVEHLPPRGNSDALVAADVSARMGVPHVLLPQPGNRARLEFEKNRRTHYCSDEHAQFVVLAPYLEARTGHTFDGIAGDVLSQSSYLTPAAMAAFAPRDAVAAAAFVLDGYGTAVSERGLASLLSPPFLREVSRERAAARLARAIQPHLDAPNPVASFFFWNRTRREIALSPYGLLSGVTVFAPYLDHDLFDMLSALPASLLADRRLHTDAIARAFPEYADITYEKRARLPGPDLANVVTAAALAGAAVRGRRLLRPDRLVPRLLVRAVRGSAPWHTPLTLLLAQLDAVVNARDR